MTKRRGCWWWTVTICVGLFLLGLVLVYPYLWIPTVLLGIAIVIYTIDKRRYQ